MNIPIYRAKKIDSDEYLFGTGTTDFLNINKYEYPKYSGDGRVWLWSNYSWIEIDQSTLAMSIDSGENFYSISFITRAIEDHIEATEVQE